MSDLRDRCREAMTKVVDLHVSGRGLDAEELLLSFVLGEKGRRAPEIEESRVLVLYFETEADREEVSAVIRLAKPGMREVRT